MVDGPRHQARRFGVVVLELPGQCLDEGVVLGLHPALGQPRQGVRVAPAGDQGVHHRSPGYAEDVGGHRGEFDLGVLQELFRALLGARAFLGRHGAGAGEVPRLPDRLRGHERGP
jgi:hypothetical protein